MEGRQGTRDEKAKAEAMRNPMKRPLPKRLDSHTHPIVYLEVTDGGTSLGRIIIELFDDVSPMAAENFRCLCTGEAGKGNSGVALDFRKTAIHHVSDAYISGGDIVSQDGTGGDSIFGRRFPIENHTMRHTGEGVVAMVATQGLVSISSQFIIALKELPEMDGRNAVVGRVVEGIEVVKKLARYTNVDGAPLNMLTITGCGEMTRSARKDDDFMRKEREMKEDDRKAAEREREEAKGKELEDDDDTMLAIKSRLQATKRKARVVEVGDDDDEDELDFLRQKSEAKHIAARKRRKFF